MLLDMLLQILRRRNDPTLTQIINKYWPNLRGLYEEVLYMRKYYGTYRKPNWKLYFHRNYYEILRMACNRYRMCDMIREIVFTYKNPKYVEYACKMIRNYFDSYEMYYIIKSLYLEKYMWYNE